MDAGTVSSWVAAGISLSSVGGAALWSWWNRPVIDWLPSGNLGRNRKPGNWVHLDGSMGNFGDGNAHRVSVWYRRSPRHEPERISTSPLLKPGDSIDFQTHVHLDTLDQSVVWVTWTPAPLRHRSECTHEPLLIEEEFELDDWAQSTVEMFRAIQG